MKEDDFLNSPRDDCESDEVVIIKRELNSMLKQYSYIINLLDSMCQSGMYVQKREKSHSWFKNFIDIYYRKTNRD